MVVKYLIQIDTQKKNTYKRQWEFIPRIGDKLQIVNQNNVIILTVQGYQYSEFADTHFIDAKEMIYGPFDISPIKDLQNGGCDGGC
jgi:hypothetical protein